MLDAMKKFGCEKFYVGLATQNSNFTELKNYGESIKVSIGQIDGHGKHIHCGPIDTNHIIEGKDE